MSCLSISNCSSGMYINAIATAATDTVCQNCEVGKYSDNQNSKTCKLCPAGKFQNIPGNTQCLNYQT